MTTQSCSGAADDFSATDNSNFAMAMMGLVTVMAMVFIFFLRSQYRRRRLDVTWHKEHDHDFDVIDEHSDIDTKSSVKSYDSIKYD